MIDHEYWESTIGMPCRMYYPGSFIEDGRKRDGEFIKVYWKEVSTQRKYDKE